MFFFYLIEWHTKFLWHTLQVLYICTLYDSTNINTKIEFAPSGEMHNYCTPHIIKENFQYFLIHQCNYILLSQVYCVWQVVKTPTVILNNPVLFTCTDDARPNTNQSKSMLKCWWLKNCVAVECYSCDSLWQLSMSVCCVNWYICATGRTFASTLYHTFQSFRFW